MRHAVLLGLVLIPAASPALADICAWNDPAVARRAAAMLKPGDTVQGFCPGCGDQVAKPTKVASAGTAPTSDPKYLQVTVNGQPVDLAYTYLRTAPGGPWTNLGALVSCSTDNDSPRTLRPDQVTADAAQQQAPQSAPQNTPQSTPLSLAQILSRAAAPVSPPTPPQAMAQSSALPPQPSPAPGSETPQRGTAADGLPRGVTVDGWVVRYDPVPNAAVQPWRCILTSPSQAGAVGFVLTYLKATEIHFGVWNLAWNLAEGARGTVVLAVGAKKASLDVTRWSSNTVGITPLISEDDPKLRMLDQLLYAGDQPGLPLVITLPNGQQSNVPRITSAVQGAMRQCVEDLEQARRKLTDPFSTAPPAINTADPFAPAR